MTSSPSQTKLILVGGGGHAKVVADAAISAGWTILGFLDDVADTAMSTVGFRRLGSLDDWRTAGEQALLMPAIGDNALRRRCVEQWVAALGDDGAARTIATVIHASAVVSPSAQIGLGTFCSALSVINAGAVLGQACIINTSAVVEHDGIIGAGVHLAPRAALGGNVHVGSGTLVGIGAVVRPGISIGDQCTIGAGAVVVADVDNGETVVGNPARVSEPASGSEIVARHR